MVGPAGLRVSKKAMKLTKLGKVIILPSIWSTSKLWKWKRVLDLKLKWGKHCRNWFEDCLDPNIDKKKILQLTNRVKRRSYCLESLIIITKKYWDTIKVCSSSTNSTQRLELDLELSHFISLYTAIYRDLKMCFKISNLQKSALWL